MIVKNNRKVPLIALHNNYNQQSLIQAKLASVTSKEINDFINSMGEPHRIEGDEDGITIGAIQADNEGDWTWQDGSPWGYENWSGGEPNDHQGVEDCAEIVLNVHDRQLEPGYWNDVGCFKYNHFVCSKQRGTM